MTEQVEVKIVGTSTSAVEAIERARNAVSESTGKMRAKLSELQATSSEAFGAMGLSAKLGADRVQAAARDTATATQRMRSAVSGVSTSFRGMGVAAVGVAAVVGFALGSVARDLIDVAKAGLEYAGSLGETAQSLGVTTAFMQAFRYAATQNGASVAGADNALGKFSITLGKAFEGSKPAIASFESLGINMRELEQASDSRRFELVADAISRIKDPARQSAAAVAIFGRGAREIIPTLQAGAAGFRQQAAEAQKYGLILSDSQIQSADKTADKIDQLTQALQVKIAGVVASNSEAIGVLANSLANLADKAVKAGAAYLNWRKIVASDAGGSAGAASKKDLWSTRDGRVSYYQNRKQKLAYEHTSLTTGKLVTNTPKKKQEVEQLQREMREVAQYDAMMRKREAEANAKPTKPKPAEPPTITTPTGGGGGSKARPERSSKPAAAQGPSIVETWRDELNDALDAEKNWGADEAAFTADFWQKKLSATKAGTAEQKQIEREVARSRTAAHKDDIREQAETIRVEAEMRQVAAQAEIEGARTVLAGKFDLLQQQQQRGEIGNVTAARQRADLNRQLYALDLAEAEREYQIKIDSLRAEAALGGIELAEKRKINRQIQLLQTQHDAVMKVKTKQASQQEAQDAEQTVLARRQNFAEIASGWSQSLSKMLTLQQGFGTTFRSMWGTLVGVFQQAIARMIELWLISLVTKEASSKAFNATQILLDAKAAAAGAWRAVVGIPIVGPILAPIAAATAFAGVMAFSAQDGYDVPSMSGPGIDGKGGQVGIVHPREMVLPADIADRLRSGGGGGGDTFHIHAVDGESVRRMAMKHGSALADGLRQHVRKGGRLAT
ncbi:hypothetical protein [Sphingomonas sp. HMP6]|uniref:hypothetical protein n=1 Tax=Sphingomonas sp. HMP6 TaxID=1517551 RepID=UPI0015970AEF|nr:hypothetical protein [Sphingomonas sp. HMP6]BCA57681.1 hypothetical protein HMP06_0450 [Sphingomonas sp. HMP6]